ncbi:DUF4292 domain-containing protein [Flavobacteriaceae bacterium TP-CH-4]|uniref:DUF4292 domain-containing protein n=1 Tax=Pelagihabitans pacificus TaxID=2696054 RepID=A0A967EDA5_9FLAO|nr:DUF4292 domain-containing protein [Pelagihabitans pacificus]NHF59133.1 DUF4292 domain-containing protein [Pelagihabitans pacificus]
MGEYFRGVQRGLVIGMVILFLTSCKTTKVASGGEIDDRLTAKAIIREHYQNHLQFKTISGKLKIEYSDGESTQSIPLSLRMEKDKAIWISAPLGIVKAYITPGRVSFYNKLQNEYFDGDFSYLSNLLGTELDFEQVQNLLLGQAILDLKDGKYDAEVADDTYQLKPKKVAELFKILFQIEPNNFKIATQQLSQPLKKRLLQINYKNYQKIDKWILPNEIAIAAIDGDIRNTIDIEYRNIQFDQALNFPYKIPKGFKEIVLSTNDL